MPNGDLRVKIRKSWIDGAWIIYILEPSGWCRATLIWKGNAAKNWFGLQGAVAMALDRARKGMERWPETGSWL